MLNLSTSGVGVSNIQLLTIPIGSMYGIYMVTIPIGSMYGIYMVTFTLNIPQMLAYIPYMDTMGYNIKSYFSYLHQLC